MRKDKFFAEKIKTSPKETTKRFSALAGLNFAVIVFRLKF